MTRSMVEGAGSKTAEPKARFPRRIRARGLAHTRGSEGSESESRGHVNGQFGAGPYLRNEHPWGRIGWGPHGTGPLPTARRLAPRGEPSNPQLGRCGSPVEHGSTLLTTRRKIEGRGAPKPSAELALVKKQEGFLFFLEGPPNALWGKWKVMDPNPSRPRKCIRYCRGH